MKFNRTLPIDITKKASIKPCCFNPTVCFCETFLDAIDLLHYLFCDTSLLKYESQNNLLFTNDYLYSIFILNCPLVCPQLFLRNISFNDLC